MNLRWLKWVHFQKAEQIRILKENFRVNGQYEDEDAAYLEFKRCESKGNLNEIVAQGNKLKSIGAYINYYFQLYVFDFIGRYATDPTRVLLNMVIAVVGYGLVFYFISEFLPKVHSLFFGSTLLSRL